MADPNEHLYRLAAESLAAGDPTGWFERLYADASGGIGGVPWDRTHAHSVLVEWFETRGPDPAGRRALVVGFGLGADAEYVAGLGYETTAFDISPSAVRAVRARYPQSPVRYVAVDLLDPPAQWRAAFDLVVECNTVQSLPRSVQRMAIGQLAGLVAAGGTLIVIAAGREEASDDGPPWPLTRAEIDAFAGAGLTAVQVEQLPHPDGPPIRRWRAEFRRPEDGVA